MPFHAVGDEGVALRDIATVIGRKLDLPVVSIPRDQASDHFGWMGHFIQFNVPASGQLTNKHLGWQPTGPGLIEGLETGTYFRA